MTPPSPPPPQAGPFAPRCWRPAFAGGGQTQWSRTGENAPQPRLILSSQAMSSHRIGSGAVGPPGLGARHQRHLYRTLRRPLPPTRTGFSRLYAPPAGEQPQPTVPAHHTGGRARGALATGEPSAQLESAHDGKTSLPPSHPASFAWPAPSGQPAAPKWAAKRDERSRHPGTRGAARR